MTKKKMFFYNGTNFVSFGTGTTTQSEAFITATGITDSVQKDAIRELVNNLIGYSVYSKLKAIYPMVGGSASSHKYNLIDPRDLDAAFRLVFSGTWIHSATGAKPNGTNAYANALANNSNILINNNHISYYSRTEIAQLSNIEMGSLQTVSPNKTLLSLTFKRADGSTTVSNTGQSLASELAKTFDIATSKGLLLNSKTSSTPTDLKLFFNGEKKANATTTSGGYGFSINPLFIGALNNGGSASNFSSKECAFASIGEGFSDAQANLYYQIVQLYQTRLSRQV